MSSESAIGLTDLFDGLLPVQREVQECLVVALERFGRERLEGFGELQPRLIEQREFLRGRLAFLLERGVESGLPDLERFEPALASPSGARRFPGTGGRVS